MSEFSIDDIGDDMLKKRLKEKASQLDVSEEDLIENYILNGINDNRNNFSSKNMDYDEIKQILMNDKQEDAKKGRISNQKSVYTLLNNILSK